MRLGAIGALLALGAGYAWDGATLVPVPIYRPPTRYWRRRVEWYRRQANKRSER